MVVIIGEQVQSFHFIQTIYNWSKDLIVCTNGNAFQNSAQKALLQNKGIKIIESKIKSFAGKDGSFQTVWGTLWIEATQSWICLKLLADSLPGLASNSFLRSRFL